MDCIEGNCVIEFPKDQLILLAGTANVEPLETREPSIAIIKGGGEVYLFTSLRIL